MLAALYVAVEKVCGDGRVRLPPPKLMEGGDTNFEHPLTCIWLFHNVETVRHAQTLAMYQYICVHTALLSMHCSVSITVLLSMHCILINATGQIIL